MKTKTEIINERKVIINKKRHEINEILNKCKTYRELWKALEPKYDVWSGCGNVIWVRVEGYVFCIGEYACNDVIVKKEEIAEQELYDVEAIKKINEEIQIIKLEILEEELKLEVLKSKLNKKRLEIQYSMLEEENR
jgi:hypothetical protein